MVADPDSKVFGRGLPPPGNAARFRCRGRSSGLVSGASVLLGIFLILALAMPVSAEKCFSIARLQYGGGGDWYTGPTMLPNLKRRLEKDLALEVCAEEAVVTPLSGSLYDHPILFATGHGGFSLDPEEAEALREYLLRGGLLFADDNYGLAPSFREAMAKLFPKLPLAPLDAAHPLFRSHHRFPRGLPKIHQHDGKPATAYAIESEGRTLVLFTHESDLGNGWEDPSVHGDPVAAREAALKMGVNVVAWFLAGAPAR